MTLEFLVIRASMLLQCNKVRKFLQMDYNMHTSAPHQSFLRPLQQSLKKGEYKQLHFIALRIFDESSVQFM